MTQAQFLGQQLDNYRLVSLLGSGGFAEVYLGEHILLPKTFAAVKVLKVELAVDEVDPFVKEAQIINRLKHENIVQLKNFGLMGKIPFLILEYAPKGTLRQRYPKGSTLPLATVVSYVKQVAAALQTAHDRKIVHRDVKPENMLLGSNDEVLLTDFGIAVIAQTKTQDVVGTLDYMAPEQLQGHPTSASDQYALGITVYEWLCGKRPYTGMHDEIRGQKFVGNPAPLRSHVPSISPILEQTVLRAFASSQDQRFPNVQEFALTLERVSQGGQPSPTPIPLYRPISPQPQPINPLTPLPGPQPQPINPPTPLPDLPPWPPIKPPLLQPEQPLQPFPPTLPLGGPQLQPLGPQGPVVLPQAPGLQPPFLPTATTVQQFPPFPSPNRSNTSGRRPGRQRDAFRRPNTLFPFDFGELRNPTNSFFLLWGIPADLLASIILGISWHSWWVWLASFGISLGLRVWCGSTDNRTLNILLIILLAGYWGITGLAFGAAIVSILPIGWLPDPFFIGAIAFIIGFVIHFLYIHGKYK